MGSLPIRMRPSGAGRLTGGGEAGRLGSRVGREASRVPGLLGSRGCTPKRGLSPVGSSLQCGNCAVSVESTLMAGAESSESANFTSPNSSPKSIVLSRSSPVVSFESVSSRRSSDMVRPPSLLVLCGLRLCRCDPRAPGSSCRDPFRRARDRPWRCRHPSRQFPWPCAHRGEFRES